MLYVVKHTSMFYVRNNIPVFLPYQETLRVILTIDSQKVILDFIFIGLQLLQDAYIFLCT